MSDVVLKVENLYKRYRLGNVDRGAFKEDLVSGWAKLLGRPDPYEKYVTSNQLSAVKSKEELEKLGARYVWALQDINFEVKRGEILGVIGKNGAGKSTLLKILSKTTAPTKGQVKIKGRIASLLEVGTGFHGDLTGRENIFLNGSILGMNRHEIKRKLDEITDFAGVEAFLDTPVKRYSSGMYVRLAFAVAAHLDPDILIVDEVLAVGDAEFQKKCIGKMKSVSTDEGRTVLFVSHNMQTISTLTSNSVLLNNGKVVLFNNTNIAITEYLALLAFKKQLLFQDTPSINTPKLLRAEVITSSPNNTHLHGEPLKLRFDIHTPFAIECASFSFQVLDELNNPIVHSWVFDSSIEFGRYPGVYTLECLIPKFRLYMGKYSISTHLSEYHTGRYFQGVENICSFEVVMFGKNREYDWQPNACRYIEDSNWLIKKSPDNEIAQKAN